MENFIKRVLQGILTSICVIFGVFCAVLFIAHPMILITVTENSTWYWLYVIHAILLFYIIGSEYE